VFFVVAGMTCVHDTPSHRVLLAAELSQPEASLSVADPSVFDLPVRPRQQAWPRLVQGMRTGPDGSAFCLARATKICVMLLLCDIKQPRALAARC
jgi:hypothetical protein